MPGAFQASSPKTSQGAGLRWPLFCAYRSQGDADSTALVRSFRREMNAIARGVVDFVKKYQLSTFDQQAREEFTEDYKTVYGLLAQRIEREEASLYPLYMPT